MNDIKRTTVRHAICLTGLQRDFDVIGSNIRQFLLRLVGGTGSTLTFFGVQAGDWWAIHRLLPMHIVEPQAPMCVPGFNESESDPLPWYHCSSRGRSHCTRNFLQELCDLAQVRKRLCEGRKAHMVSVAAAGCGRMWCSA